MKPLQNAAEEPASLQGLYDEACGLILRLLPTDQYGENGDAERLWEVLKGMYEWQQSQQVTDKEILTEATKVFEGIKSSSKKLDSVSFWIEGFKAALQYKQAKFSVNEH